MKMARILSGNSFDPDHWHDVAGYASLVVREIERREVEYRLETGLAQASKPQMPTVAMQELIKEMPDEPRE